MMSKELEKAIDYFKNRVSFEMPVYDEPHFKTILNALERNEPVCVQTSYEDDDNHLFNCPNCDALWYYSNEKNEWNYCPNCGQKLDWSVDDE